MTVLFDLDGTLIDSIELIRQSYVHTWRTHLGRELEPDEWLASLGRTLYAECARVAPDGDQAEADRMVATYRAHNLAHHDEMVHAYDGVPEMLKGLATAGVRVGIVTSKTASMARRGLEVSGLDADQFEVLVGADDVTRHKPLPDPILAACDQLGLDPTTTTYVGDSPHDITACRAAGARTIAVAWGPFPRASLDSWGADFVAEHPRDLLRLSA